MTKRSRRKADNAHTNKKLRGCLRAIGLYFLWFCITCIMFAELVPEEKQNGSVFFLSLFLALFLPFYIKPLRRSIATVSKKILKGHNSKTPPEPVEEPYHASQDVPQDVPVIAPAENVPVIAPGEDVPVITPVKIEIASSASASHPIANKYLNLQEEFSKSSAPSVYTNVLSNKHEKVQAELLSIDLMDGHQFENWCADALKIIGFCNISITPGSGDQGVDILADKDGVKYAFQCKRYTSDLGNTPIQEVHSGKDYYHRHVGVVITNRQFTSGAVALAAETGTLLWDREWITNYLYQKHGGAPGEAIAMQNPEKTQDDDDNDELFNAAVEIVLETGLASVSVLQRRLLLGYARAARIVDMMEDRGIVGPFEGSRPRLILITQEQWRSTQKGNTE